MDGYKIHVCIPITYDLFRRRSIIFELSFRSCRLTPEEGNCYRWRFKMREEVVGYGRRRNGGGGCVYEEAVALVEVAYRLSAFEGGEEGDGS